MNEIESKKEESTSLGAIIGIIIVVLYLIVSPIYCIYRFQKWVRKLFTRGKKKVWKKMKEEYSD
jgi:O-antigen/teichoic acid export membrane protein